MNLSHSLAMIQRSSKHSSSNVNYISKTQTLRMTLRGLPLHCPIFGILLQEWFEPGISRLTNKPLEWFDNWEAFLDKLHTNFGPDDKTGDAKHKLTCI
jgi:hypothetical protein